MCKAVQDMMDRARQEGLQEGRKAGLQEGSETARIETLRDVVKNAMESFHLSMKDQDILRKMI